MPKANSYNDRTFCNEAQALHTLNKVAQNQAMSNLSHDQTPVLNPTQRKQLFNSTQPTRKLLYWRQLLKTGPGIFVAVGYIDPGNWVTDLAGGSRAGYTLLSVVFISSLIAMLLQVMSARLGIATGKDLAQLSSRTWPKLVWPSWIAAEIAIIATDLAEVIGSAIALKLLFSIPIIIGVALTIFDVLLLIALGKKSSNFLERIVAFFLFIIGCGLTYEITLAHPALHEIVRGFAPSVQIVTDPQLLYLAMGIIGATIMPHNLYLHSNLVVQRWPGKDKRQAAFYATFDTLLLLSGAMILNSALVILAASVFHTNHVVISEITDAHHLLSPLLGSGIAAVVFAVMLLASGQSATITGTLAGQVVINGFIRIKMKPWLRRLITRSMALVIALITISYFGESHIASLLIASQVLLSLQLPLAMIPLLLLTSDKNRMGTLANSAWMRRLGYFSLSLIVIANTILMISLCY